MRFNVEEVPSLRGYTVEWAEKGNFYLSRGNRVYRSADLTPPFEFVAAADAPLYKTVAAKSRLAQRLLRFLVTNVVPLGNGDLFLTFDKSVGVVREGRYRPLAGLQRPCRVLRSGCAVAGDGSVYFGEYLANNERGPMNIYRFRPGSDRLDVVRTFPAGSIKHVHGIYLDKHTGALYCLTGDEDKECAIIRTFDGFETIETVGGGDESWRAVSLQFAPDAIYYGTDAEFRENQIYRLDRSNGERTVLGEVSGTVFYSKKRGDHYFFSTAAENAPSQRENVAAIWALSSEGEVTEIASFKKDRWHPTLFMFGTIHFPYHAGGAENELHFHIVGAEGDNRTFKLITT